MLQAFINVFKIPELRNKILFTLGMLVVFRIGHWIPIPGINQEALASFFQNQGGGEGAVQRMATFVAMFSGGDLGKSTIFGLGILPYISASIIFQLLASALPALKKLQEEGASGRQKIMEWTRYAAVGLCIIQSVSWLKLITANGLVYMPWANQFIWWLMAVSALTAGTIFLMWLGEQIDRFGIGNGVSLIIMAGILTSMPQAVLDIYSNFDPGDPNKMGWMGVLLILGGFFLVVGGAVIMTVAQRRIPVQQAKHTRGRKVYGGQKSYLPLRVNHGGVMPVIFASSLMIFPSVIFSGMADATNAPASGWQGSWLATAAAWLSINFANGEFPYIICEVLLIYFFSYFWITVQFNPDEMAKQLRDHGSFIPGLRPGPRTAEYIETVMERITFVGAAFLAVLATLPLVVNKSLGVSWAVSSFLGGTGLLIVVSVCLDFVQRVEANLLMRNYAGFLGGNDDGSGPRMRGPRG
jgi:preprotein translocase subunit SecY